MGIVPPRTENARTDDAAPGDEGLSSALRVSVMRLARRLRLERSSEDLSLNQLSVLGTLLRSGELTLGELAAIERVKPPSITRTVNCLVDAGLVTRRPHATDGRQVMADLTEHARTVLDEDRRRRDLWLARRLDELGPADRELLRRVAPLLDVLAAS
ncbi:MAG TPA: MarR family transcriptional regulator [Ilumatobacteraceae bacterium]|nr:MarR family transcriptional regulator [Ilumatobacteraceae bacterium]